MAYNIHRIAKKLEKPVTRDSFLTWNLNYQSYCRQNPAFRKFLPGGTLTTWKAYDEDETRGINVIKVNAAGADVLDDEATDATRSALSEFLSSLGGFYPENFTHTVVFESTSYNWVMDRIKITFKLETKGIGFLTGGNIKIDFGEDGQTHQQGFQAVKEFYCNSLQKEGSLYKEKTLTTHETLTPLSENFIVEKWLEMIDTRLKQHIAQTRGHLFTPDRPNLYDVQAQLCEQMDTMLQELSASSVPSVGRAGFQPQGMPRRVPYQQQHRRAGPPRSPSAAPHMAGRPSGSRAGCPPDTCVRCFEARRFGPASKNHRAATCPFPKNNHPMRILLVNQTPTNNQTQLPRIQEIQLQPSLLDQSQPGQPEAAQEEEYYDDSPQNYDSELYDDYTQSLANKDYYYYLDSSLFPSTHHDSDTTPDTTTTTLNPTVSVIPTRSIQKFSFLNKGSQAQLSLDSGCEGCCMTEAEAIRLGVPIIPLDPADNIPH